MAINMSAIRRDGPCSSRTATQTSRERGDKQPSVLGAQFCTQLCDSLRNARRTYLLPHISPPSDYSCVGMFMPGCLTPKEELQCPLNIMSRDPSKQDTKWCRKERNSPLQETKSGYPARHLSHCATQFYSEQLGLGSLKFVHTRWFKYDRDDLCVNKSQFVPVIFEPPCIIFKY